MPTDVSSFKNAYKTAVKADFPETAELVFGGKRYSLKTVPYALRYGTNPHQPFTAYLQCGMKDPAIGNLEMLKGGKDGLSLTNMQDMSQALNILKYFNKPACAVMKHVNPCGFKVQTSGENLESIYRSARASDERSAFGSIIGFNAEVDGKAANAVMETFVEGIIAPSYTAEAIEILKKNENTKRLNNSIRVGKYNNIGRLPKFIGDDTDGYFNLRNLADGCLTIEIPYLTRIKSVKDFIIDPMIPNSDPAINSGKDFNTSKAPSASELEDALTAWYLNVNVRSNGIVFVRDGMALAVGTGEQERIGAVEKAIDKALKKGHNLKGSVMSSDAFFPQRDCIDLAGKYGVSAIVWPAGSLKDAEVIQAANENNIALIATLERCFLHI